MSNKYRPPVSPMFAEGQDLPLFSETPLEVEERPWNPQPIARPEAPSVDMFAEAAAPEEPAPQLGKLCGHLGVKLMHGGTGNYVAECALCHVHGPIAKTAHGAKTALVNGVKGPRV